MKIGTEKTEVIDISGVLDRLGGDRELFQEVVVLFLEEAPEEVQKVKQAIDGGRWEEAAKLAHSLKGSSSNVGAERFSALAMELELASGEQKKERAMEIFELLVKELGAIREFISKPERI